MALRLYLTSYLFLGCCYKVDKKSKMLWDPLNLSTSCPANINLTACSSFGYVYLDLLVRLFGRSRDKYSRTRDFGIEVYDFVVVGAGSAGCIVANRLSAFEKWKVLLLEAGPEEPDITSAPALGYALLGSNIDWQYQTQPDGRSCLSRVGHQCPWPRGKTMGGSSSINSLAYVRGNSWDYDTWAKMGNPGWSYKEVLPYFKMSENNLEIEYLNNKYHGADGEQPISSFPYIDSPTMMLINGMHKLGFPIIDFNAKHQDGTFNSQSFSYNGARVSSNQAFIKPIRDVRDNLIVKTNAEATKILIDDNKVAYGVKYIRNGKEFTAIARKEVILSAGVINSPKLLMCSGIGPADHLKSARIKVVQDLSVGENLQDHPTFNSLLISVPMNNTLVSNHEILDDVIDYSDGNRRNPLTGDGVGKAMSFYRTDKDLPAPDIQYQFQGVRLEEFEENPTYYNNINILPAAYYNGIGVRVMNLTPKSRGYLRLNITNPNEKPIIHANYFNNPDDFSPIISGSNMIFGLEHTEAFRKVNAKFYKRPIGACKKHKWGSDDYIICMARHYTDTTYHPVGTCKMGPTTDKDAVVDPKLKVYGIKGLRVIDASIMPLVIRGNTNAPAMLIGERGVDFVIDYWYRNILH